MKLGEALVGAFLMPLFPLEEIEDLGLEAEETFEPAMPVSEALLRRWPVLGRVTSGFNLARIHPITGKVKPHYGVDIAAPYGTPVETTGSGVVSFAGWQPGYGNTVIVNHGDERRTLYAHLSSVYVLQREEVVAGTIIGSVGMTGSATGNHLHYELRERGLAVPPGLS